MNHTKKTALRTRRMQIALRLAQGLLLATGLPVLIAGLFAYQLGLDNDLGWGKGRVLLTATGLLLLLFCLIVIFFDPLRVAMRRLVVSPQRLLALLGQNRVVTALRNSYKRASTSRLGRFWFQNATAQVVLATALIALVYLWYLTGGMMTRWTPYTGYFDLLGDAFRSGQVALLVEPPPELAALPDPYNWQEREGVSHLWDVSYYQGKYYLYWGPVPGLLAALATSVTGNPVEDQFLLFFFTTGLVLFFGLVLIWLRRRFYPTAPAWSSALFTLLAGLCIPVLWLVNRPSVYETAIAGGQFFLFAGLYCALRAVLRDNQPNQAWLFAAGFAWGAAVASRLNLALVVIFFAAVLSMWLIRRQSGLQVLLPLVALGTPLAAWAAGLGWYNFARFGSILETGHRYQLTGPALPANYSWVTSISYALPSLYSYLVRPLHISLSDGFPFVFAPFLGESSWPFFINLPEHYYYPEPVAGIFAAVPAALLLLLPFARLAQRSWNWLKEQPAQLSPSQPGETLTWVLVAGGSLLLFAPLLVFISTSMRYLADFTPMVVLLSALAFWSALRAWQPLPAARRGLVAITVILMLASIMLSLLVNFGNGDRRFEAINPALFQEIAGFFNRIVQ